MLAWPVEHKQPPMKKKTGKDTSQLNFTFGISHFSHDLFPFFFFLIPITTYRCLEGKKPVLIFVYLKVLETWYIYIYIYIFFADTSLFWMWRKQCLTQKETAKKEFQALEPSPIMCKEDLFQGWLGYRLNSGWYNRWVLNKPMCLPSCECMWLEMDFGPKMTI